MATAVTEVVRNEVLFSFNAWRTFGEAVTPSVPVGLYWPRTPPKGSRVMAAIARMSVLLFVFIGFPFVCFPSFHDTSFSRFIYWIRSAPLSCSPFFGDHAPLFALPSETYFFH